MAKYKESEWLKGLKAAEACYKMYASYDSSFPALDGSKLKERAIEFMVQEMEFVEVFEGEERLAGWTAFVDHIENRMGELI